MISRPVIFALLNNEFFNKAKVILGWKKKSNTSRIRTCTPKGKQVSYLRSRKVNNRYHVCMNDIKTDFLSLISSILAVNKPE